MKLIALICVALACAVAHSQSRRELDRSAQREFQELHFFSQGRGMMLSPGLISMYNFFVPGLGMINRDSFAERWGVAYNNDDKISGLHEVEHKGHKIGVMGCVVCHSGRAAGQFVIGLGNKNIDVWKMGTDVNQIEKHWKNSVPSIFKDDSYRDMEDAALAFSSYLGNTRLGNLTQGLVPISFIRGWFYRIHKEAVPQDMPKGQVKVPFLWGYGEKRKVGQFCDGYGDGNEVGWAIAVELAAGQTPEAVRGYYEKVKAAEHKLEFLLPPAYPFEVDQSLADSGRQVFNQSCSSCHGQYSRDAEGHPVFQSPMWISSEVVRTDIDRVAGHSADFNRLVNTSPLSDIIRYNKDQHGYFAPRLEGIWARFPYLHNGSVPTLADLLETPASRPKAFSLKRAGEKERFDRKRMGLTVPAADQDRLAFEGRNGARDVYWTERVGHSNQGHDFAAGLNSGQKLALLEYMKTL